MTPVASLLATVLSYVAAFHCMLMVEKGSIVGQQYEVYVGYWKREDYTLALENGPDKDGNVCVQWGDDFNEIFDGVWKFGRALTILVALTAPIVLVVSVGLVFTVFPPNLYKWMLGFSIFDGISCFLFLLALSSDVCDFGDLERDCKFGPGSGVAIFAALIWFFVGYCFAMIKSREEDLLYGRSARSAGDIDEAEPNIENEDKGADDSKVEENTDEESPTATPPVSPATNQTKKKKKKTKKPTEDSTTKEEAKTLSDIPYGDEEENTQSPKEKKKKKKKSVATPKDADEEVVPTKSPKKKKKATANSATGTSSPSKSPKQIKKKKKKPALDPPEE